MKTVFKIWKLWALALALGVALAHGGHYLPASGPGARDFKPAKALPSVELLGVQGKALGFPPRGPAALYFGYTRCPDACPLTLARLVPAQAALGQSLLGHNLGLWMLSVDPERDTPEVLGKYLRGFAPVQGLTGDPQAIRRIAEAVGLEYNRTPGGELVFHTDALALLDGEGRLVRVIYGVSRLSVSNLKDELAGLLR